MSHPTRVRGLKQTMVKYMRKINFLSHPTRVRGLKPMFGSHAGTLGSVAPYTGAWIETIRSCRISATSLVAPYTGAWIETPYLKVSRTGRPRSHPTRVRGLKQ